MSVPAAIAVLCCALTFQLSQPLWDALPLLSLFQFPWRFLGVLALCLAVAAGGALSIFAELWSPRRFGAPAAIAFSIVVAALFSVNGFGTRDLPLKDGVDRTVNAATVLDDELRDRLGMGTTSGREFLPRSVVIEQFSRIQARGRDVMERLYPEPEWIGGIVLPIQGDLRVLTLNAEPLRATVRVENAGSSPALLGIRQAYFPGWRAWLDGRPAPLGAAPYNAEAQAAAGFLIATIPPGEHTLAVAFGPTRLRAAALLLTFTTVALTAWLVTRRSRRAPVFVATGAATLLITLFTWRGLAPAIGLFAILPLDRGDLVVNVAEAARTGAASLSSPGGPRFGAGNPYADVRFLTIVDRSEPPRGAAGVTTKDWVFLHPPSDVSLEVQLPPIQPDEQIWFQSSLALDPQTWTAPFGDGVRFQLLVGTTTLIDAPINPRAQLLHRRWVPVEADLTPWAGQRVRLTLRTDPRDELSSDWSGWGSPVIYVRHSARTRPLATAPPL